MVDILDEIDFDTCNDGLQMDIRWIESNVESLQRYLNESGSEDSFDLYSDDELKSPFSIRRTSSVADSVSICGSSSADSLFDDLDFEPCSPTCSVVTEDMLPIDFNDIKRYQDDLLSDLRDMKNDIFQFERICNSPSTRSSSSYDAGVWSDCDTRSDYSSSTTFTPIVPPATQPTYAKPAEIHELPKPVPTAKTLTQPPVPQPKIIVLNNRSLVLVPQRKIYTLAECARRGIKVKLPKKSAMTRNEPYHRPVPKRRSRSTVKSPPITRDLDSVLSATLSGKPSNGNALDLKIRDLKLLLPSFQSLKNLDDNPENPVNPSGSNEVENQPLRENHPCTECGKSHNSLTELRNCLRSNRFENNRFEVIQRRTCPTCNKVCSSPVALRVHEMVHTGEKPYHCVEPDCNNRSFREKSALKKHYKRFHPNDLANVAHHFVKKK